MTSERQLFEVYQALGRELYEEAVEVAKQITPDLSAEIVLACALRIVHEGLKRVITVLP